MATDRTLDTRYLTVVLLGRDGEPVNVDRVMEALGDNIHVTSWQPGNHLMAKSAVLRMRDAAVRAAELVHPLTPRTRALEALLDFVHAAEEAEGLPPGTTRLVVSAEKLLEANDG